MKFYEATTKSGICQKIDFICDTTDTSYPRIDKTREVNEAGKSLALKIINADGTWQFDDTNYTDLPKGTGTLVASQSSYSFNSDYLDILSVKVLDINNNWKIVKPLDQSDLDFPIEDLLEEDGLPEYYDKIGDSIILYPAPSATYTTLTNGLKVEFKREFKPFAAVTTTADDETEPGFACEHDILAYMAALPYCMKYKKELVNVILNTIAEKEKTILRHYGQREKDKRKVMTCKPINFR